MQPCEPETVYNWRAMVRVSGPARGRNAPTAPLLALLALLAFGCGEVEDLPPHVILVSLDTLRPDHLSVYGYERDTSPFLDELARESVTYTNAYAAASWTLLSHMTMLTGIYPGRHGVTEDLALAPEVPLLAQRLRDESYYNVGVYFDGWISPRFGFDRGFDVFEARGDAARAGKAMIEAVEQRPKNRPLFLFFHLFDVHCGNVGHPNSTMYDSAPRYANMFRDGAAARVRGRPIFDIYYGDVRATPEEALDFVALYDSGVRSMDDRLRRWVRFWREEGLLDDAILIITSDHGEALGQHGLWKGHGGFSEAGLRVPLLVRYPNGHGAGTRDERLVSSVDLVPTVMGLLERSVETWLPGRSLLGLPRGPADVILAERDRTRAVMNGRLKMLWDRVVQRGQVWDVLDDPLERKPMPRSLARTVHRGLRESLDASDERTASTPGVPIPAGKASDEERAELEALGYGGGD